MTQKTWSTVEISAYLDGELEPKHQAAFESDLADDPTLRRRVEEMEQVVSLVRSVPLREPPRNYLLTPSMVAKEKPRRERRRTPLFVMRLATSLVALAFVVSFGLTMMQRGLVPEMFAGSQEKPEAALMLEEAVEETTVVEAPAPPPAPEDATTAMKTETEQVEEPEALIAPQEEAPAEEAPQEGVPEGEGPIKERAVAPTPESAEMEEGDAPGGPMEGPDGAPPGLGELEAGENDTPVAALEAVPDEAPAPPDEAPAPPEGTLTVPEESPVASEAVEEFAVEEEPSPREPADSERAPGERAVSDEELAQPVVTPEAQNLAGRARRSSISLWLPVGLGIATVVLTAITFWLSRRDLG
ncbi:MAG: hypothetical protein ACP5HG_04585 [Anaerolineae bacterium]